MTPPALELRAVTRRFGPAPAVAQADLVLEAGQIACLLGPSGCGKSTLLRIVAGLEAADAGEVRVAGSVVTGPGAAVPPERRDVGIVFQDLALFPHLDAVGNVAFGLRHLPKARREARALELLERFRIGHRARAWPHTLSGGEQQRVAIARALARGPKVLLLDEPFSGLDGELKAEVREAVLAGLRESGTTVLLVTHDPEEAMAIADRLVLMEAGRILQSGTPEDCYRRPVSVGAARLLGPANVLPARVSHGLATSDAGFVEVPGRPDGPATLIVRPEALRLEPGGAPALVRRVRFAGAAWQLRLEANGRSLIALQQREPPGEGERVGLAIDPAGAHCLDA